MVDKRTVVLLLVVVLACTGLGAVNKSELIEIDKEVMTKHPKFIRAQDVTYEFDGFLNEYLEAISENWLKVAPERNPAMLEMFADREKKPTRNLLAWSGEFAGKYLTAAVQVLRLTKDRELRDYLENFVNELVKLQAEDGYLGPWPQGYQLTGKGPNVFGAEVGGTWDAWGHYHIMLGLLLWFEETGDERTLNAASRMGDLMCDKFLEKPGSFAGIGSCEMNLAPIHSLCLLYRKTGNQRYLDLARQILVDEFSRSGKWFKTAMEGKEFYQAALPRWESLHPIMGIVELYWLTGNEDYKKAFERIWWSIVKLDRHNTGGFSSGERAKGNPYDLGAIETCCTIAWTALSVEMLKLTGSPIVADELELTFMNAILGQQSRTGRWSTYNTPMDGKRIPNTTAIGFQKRPGSEELNCCSVNAARGFGLISDWALMTDDEGLILNWYGPSTMSAKVEGVSVTLKQETNYPRTGHILLRVLLSRSVEFDLKLRIPYWSERSHVRINDTLVKDVAPGNYFVISRKWKHGDTIEMELDMSLHYWVGEKECKGKTSIYHGPILLAYNTKDIPGDITFSEKWRPGLLHSSRDAGATAEYNFEGSSISWIGRYYDDAGRVKVEIDGKKVAIVDQYGPVREKPFLWKYEGLGSGKHKIKLTVLKEKNEKSKDNWVNIEKFSQFEEDVLVFDAMNMKPRLIGSKNATWPIILMELSNVNGDEVRLNDFDSAGEKGEYYITWLKVNNIPKAPFSHSNPLRSGRVGR